MRGPRAQGKPGSSREGGVLPSSAATKTVPAPVGGWNARDALANMNPTDAVVMDNFYPETGTVNLRPGKITWATGLTGTVKSILPFNSTSTNKLFASTNTAIYDVTAQGAVGASVATCTSGKWEFRNFTNAGGSRLVMVNGVDKMKVYDGTTWLIIDGASTPAITGIATTDITNLHIFKHRLWFIKANSMSAYYLGIDAFGGSAVEFPMGPNFTRGGYLVAQHSWTIDGGQGLDDYLVTVTSEGELAVYQGTDPSTAATFALVGTYFVGKPLGKKCFAKYGGDLLYLSKQGVFPLSSLLQSATIERTRSLSNKIDNAFKEAILQYSNNFGWSATLHPTQSAVIINVPIQEGAQTVQFVMNDITKSWCRFLGWNADVFQIYGDEVYSAIGSVVYKNWIGTSDAGMPISGKCQQAYLSIGPIEKFISLVRPNIMLQGSVTIQTAIDTDFALFSNGNSDSYLSLSSGVALWDSGIWDTSVWSGGLIPVGGQWLTNCNNPGFFHSFRLQCTSSTATLNWVSTDYAYQKAGIL